MEELSPAQLHKQVSSVSESSGYYSQSSQEDKEQPPKGCCAEVSQTIIRIKVVVSRINPDGDSDPERFYAKGCDERVLCVHEETVCVLADTGENDPSRQNEFILGDVKPFNNGDIKGTKAKLRTVNGTPIGVCISDPRHPERAKLKPLNGTTDKSLNPLVEAVIYEDVIKPRTMICYPNGKTYYYIVPSSNSTSITVIPDGPPTYPVKKEYICWTHVPSCTQLHHQEC